MSAPRNKHSRRVVFAITRLVFLFVAFCYVLLEIGFVSRTLLEAGPFQSSALPASGSSAYPAQFAGINVALEQYDTVSQRRAALANIRAAGFGWVRQRADWRLLEPSPGTYVWGEMDGIIADVIGAGLEIVIVLDGSPAWARASQDRPPTDNPFSPPANNADFARFAAALAQRYAKDVRFYQIWDEPNVAPHWGNRLIEPVAYARLLAESVPSLRAADTDAVILLAALAPTKDRGHTAIDEAYYLRRLYAAGAASYFDAVAAQPFGFGLAPTDTRSRTDVLNFQRIGLLRRVMVVVDDGEKPIWAVRYGWNRSTSNVWQTVTPDMQASYIKQANELAKGWSWLAGLGWAVDRPAVPADDPLWGFALYTPDGVPLPLWDTFVSVNRSSTSSVASSSLPHFLRFLGWFLALLAILWRGWSAEEIAQIDRWPACFSSLPPIVRIASWIVLVSIYYFATWPPLIGLCWLVAALFLAAQPSLILILVGLLLPFHYQHKEIELVGAIFAVPPVYAVLLCGLPGLVWSWRGKMHNHWFGHRSTDWLALGWLAASLCSAVATWNWIDTPAGLWALVIGPLLLYTVVRATSSTPLARSRVGSGLATGGILAGLIGLFLWWSGDGTLVDGIRRLVGLTFSPNQVALLFERSVFVCLGLTLANRSNVRWIWLAGAGVMALGLLLTGSRGALFLGVPAGLGLFLMQQPSLRPWLKRYIWLIGVAAISLLAGGILFLGERLLNSATVIQRLHIWQGALDLWRAFPWLGTGPGGFFWHYPAFMTTAAANEPNLLHPHNIWLELATGWGVLGLLWLLVFGYWLVRRATSPAIRLSGLEVGLLAGLVAGISHGQVDAFGLLPELAAWNWLAIGLLSTESTAE